MEILQKEFFQWHNQLEEQIKCYFCREVFYESNIYSCEFGHNTCSSCKVQYCLACKSPQPFIQNHFAEMLVKQFTALELKVNEINWSDFKPIKPKTANISCQTTLKKANKMCSVTNEDLKLSDKELSSETTEASDNLITPPGFYPCINKFCKFVGTYSNIVQHFESNHSSQFAQIAHQKLPFSKSWELTYSGDNSQIIRVVDIKKLGLFVLHFFINGDGEMKGNVLLYNIRKYSQQYEYNLEIECEGKKVSQDFVVDTCRIPEHTLYDPKHGLFISKNVLLYDTLRSKLMFKCTVRIAEVSELNKKTENTQKKSENTNSENRQRRENRNAYNQRKNESKQKKLNKSQSKPMTKNPNLNKSIPSLLENKMSAPSVPSSSSTSNNPQFLVNQMPGLSQSNPPLYPELTNFGHPSSTPYKHPSSAYNHMPATTSPHGNMPPPFFASPTLPVVNYEYQRQPPVFEQTHYINVQTGAIPPSAPVVDNERQEKIKQGVEAVQKAHLKKLGIHSAEYVDDVEYVEYVEDNRPRTRRDFTRKRNGRGSQHKPDQDGCVIS